MSMSNVPEISIVVPTYREEANLRPLVERIAAAMQNADAPARAYEVLIADDNSQDGTEQTAADLAKQYPVKLIVRTGTRDLSLAVMDGLRQARGQYLVVMDADLSHPPEQIPAMLALLDQPPTEFVIGSRYVSGGQTQDWGGGRRLNSYVATILAKPLTGGITDPMSGFFALRRATFERGKNFNPIGYKIGLELIRRCECRHVAEVPITFHNRVRGQSKLNFEQQARYLIHLDRLYRDYRRGWGVVTRPVLWSMLGGTRLLQAGRALLRGQHK
jgi:dolichol-phosphate mannosyltransferase